MSIRALCLGSATAAAMLATVASGAQAAERHGWYFGLEGGVVKLNDTSHGFFSNVHYGNGWAGLAEVGYALNGRWRVELEGGYRRNPVSSYLKDGWKKTWEHEGEAEPSGALTEGSLMANLIYDIQLFERFSLALGVGAGGSSKP